MYTVGMATPAHSTCNDKITRLGLYSYVYRTLSYALMTATGGTGAAVRVAEDLRMSDVLTDLQNLATASSKLYEKEKLTVRRLLDAYASYDPTCGFSEPQLFRVVGYNGFEVELGDPVRLTYLTSRRDDLVEALYDEAGGVYLLVDDMGLYGAYESADELAKAIDGLRTGGSPDGGEPY